ncbi:MAG TPA: sigma-70 family RNA polymerase sigma factor [Chloroflexota bacterium]|nr:sigma-70 family RNA polymerase sigma factor [Chloroflexota bacterium]
MPALHTAPSDHLSAMYAQYAETARALACRLLYDHTEAEDVVNDVFLTLWLRPDCFDPDRGTARAWLLTVVRNRSLDHLRRRAVHPREDVADLADRLPDLQTPDVPDQVDAAARSDLLWRIVDTLPPGQADLVRRSFMSDQTHQEIADDTGLPLGTVKSRIRLGLGKLRCAMESKAELAYL